MSGRERAYKDGGSLAEASTDHNALQGHGKDACAIGIR
jgi:hypothetical protein